MECYLERRAMATLEYIRVHPSNTRVYTSTTKVHTSNTRVRIRINHIQVHSSSKRNPIPNLKPNSKQHTSKNNKLTFSYIQAPVLIVILTKDLALTINTATNKLRKTMYSSVTRIYLLLRYSYPFVWCFNSDRKQAILKQRKIESYYIGSIVMSHCSIMLSCI